MKKLSRGPTGIAIVIGIILVSIMKGATIWEWLIVLGFLAIYFLPTFVASKRMHHNKIAIFVLNLLLGWTILGWVAALVWSATAVMPTDQIPLNLESMPSFQRQSKHIEDSS